MEVPAPRRDFVCQFCHKRFPRLEHVQRHERTHTKETPFKCPCGRSFSRRDLLRRHEKAAHNSERIGQYEVSGSTLQTHDMSSNFDPSIEILRSNSAAVAGIAMGNSLAIQASIPQSSPSAQPQGSLHLSSLLPAESIGTSHGESQGNSGLEFSWPTDRAEPANSLISKPLNQINSDISTLSNVAGDLSAFYDCFDGFESFLDMVNFTPSMTDEAVDEVAILEPLRLSFLSTSERLQNHLPAEERDQRQGNNLLTTRPDQDNTFSRFGSPLPSLEFSQSESDALDLRSPAQYSTLRPCWRITKFEYQQLTDKIKFFSHILPSSFQIPSRHRLSRYLEGCMRGLFTHLPFLHIPTFSVTEAAPELVLAIAAIGAQFRFEHHQSLVLFYAAKSVTLEQIQKRDKAKVEELLSGDHRRNNNPVLPLRSENIWSSRLEAACVRRDTNSVDKTTALSRQLQTTQALLILLIMGAWGPQQLVREAISFQSLAATLLRENFDRSSRCEKAAHTLDWRTWALVEERKRTKLIVFCVLEMISVAYDTPPLFLSAEIDCYLPAQAGIWKAKTGDDWKEAHLTCEVQEATFRESLESLYQGNTNRVSTIPSPLGNYVIIVAILQQIFLRRQDSTVLRGHSLHSDDVSKIACALKQWQRCWERTPESSVDPLSSAGPVAFNSTALLRLAWIRLYADLGPCRSLASRDTSLIVLAFTNCPPLSRGPELIYPVLQASYALAIPIRIGLDFVARTQALNWSVQHSLSNLECAIFLSKWLELMAVTSATVSLDVDELMLIQMIYSLLKETDLFQSTPRDLIGRQDQSGKIRWIATGVARVWAEIFTGTHVFEMVNYIGASLAIYAESMENEHQQTQ